MTPSRRTIRRLQLMRREIRANERELQRLCATLAQARDEVDALELALGPDHSHAEPQEGFRG